MDSNAPVLSNTVGNIVTNRDFVITVAHQPTEQMVVASFPTLPPTGHLV